MVVITLTDCPPKVRGDLSKWLCEINPGVYVGNLNARVRQELWQRVCENVKNGRATLVYSAQGEQQMKFEVHNSLWHPVDYDGIKLMQRPLPAIGSTKASDRCQEPYQSKAGKMLAAKHREAAKRLNCEYVVIDVETTGLSSEEDRIIEIAAIYIKDGEISKSYQTLIRQDKPLGKDIVELTNITDDMLEKDGIPIKNALEELNSFVGSKPIVCHNARFDCSFLTAESKRSDIKLFRSRCIDTLQLSRSKLDGVKQFTLAHLCEYLGIEVGTTHRALSDCELTFKLFEKLNEI